MQESRLEERFDDTHDSVMDHPVTVCGFANLPRLGIPQNEGLQWMRTIATEEELGLQKFEITVEILLEFLNIRFGCFSFPGPVVRCEEIAIGTQFERES